MKGVVPPHLVSRFEYLDGLKPGALPSPWRKAGGAAVGGLTHVGFADGSDTLLAISSSGRGVFDCLSGARMARDDTDYYTAAGSLLAEGIGAISGQQVYVAGYYGGGLLRWSGDGWGLEMHPLSWPDEELFLTPPGQTMLWTRHGEIASLTKLSNFLTSVVAYGFSPTGKSFVVATSSDLYFYARP